MSTATVDAKKRVVLPSGKPGDVYEVQPQDRGRLLLVRLEHPPPPRNISRETCLEAMQRTPLRPMISWEQLRRLTREP